MKIDKTFQKIFTKQHGEFSCGLACLSMVVRFHGGYVRQEDLRNISGTTLQGSTLLGLYQASEKLNFKPEAYKADISSLKEITTPTILHVTKNKTEHYVVCFEFKEDKFIIGDPADENIKLLTVDELLDIWQSKALLILKPTDSFVKTSIEKKEKYFWIQKILKDDISILSVAFVLGVFIALLGLTTAVFSQRLIDDLLPTKNFEKIISGIILFVFILLARNGLDYVRNIFLLRQTKDINNRLVDVFFSKILFLPKSFFDSTKTGEIITRLNDSGRIQQTLTYIVGNVTIDFLALLFSIVYLFISSWKMALIASLSIPLFGILVIVFNKKIIVGQRNVMVSRAAVEGQLIDFIQGVDDIKVTNKQNLFKQSIQVLYGIFQEFNYKLGVLGNKYNLFASAISIITTVLLIIFGIWLVLNGSLKLGELMAVITIGNMIINSTANLSGVNIRLQESSIAFERYYEFINAKSEFDASKEMSIHEKSKLSEICLEISNLSFRFVGRKKLFDNISIAVNKGEIVTLFGEIGSGKSTLIQILQKNYFPESGEITLNGKSIEKIPVPVWREGIGVVSQHSKIFNGSVGENICLGNYEKEKSDIIEFCKDYGFMSFINDLPQGLDTLLGEDGINISGGQRQLIALARALYRKPSLLFLDEPTASMDTKTEQFVIDLLHKNVNNFAVLMVTHRLYLEKSSTRSYHLSNGKIVNNISTYEKF